MEFLISSERMIVSNQEPYINCINALSPGERLFIRLPNSVQLAHIIIAAYTQELVTVPVDPKQSNEQLDFIYQHSESTAALLPDGIVQLSNEHHVPSANTHRFIMYTSGSTGSPKGVILSKKAVEHNALTLASMHNFCDGHATCLPLFHCNALMMSLMGCFLTQSKLLIFPQFEPIEYFKAIKRHSLRTASIVPALLYELVKAAPDWPDCLEYLITAAAPLSQQLIKDFYILYGNRLRQGYGLTEAVNFSFKMPFLDDKSFYNHYVNQYPPVGYALPETDFRLVENEVQVKGPALMEGYWKNNEATLQTFTKDGWLLTGDIGEIRDNFLVLKGRKKEIINRGGETIYPIDVEQIWEKCGLVRPFAALSIPNNILGEEIGLWINNSQVNEVISLGEKSGYYPAAVHFGHLKITATRKPQRKKMGDYLFSHNELKVTYDVIYNSAIQFAKSILKTYSSNDGDISKFLVTEAQQFLKYEDNFINISNPLINQDLAVPLLSVMEFISFHLKQLEGLEPSTIHNFIDTSLKLKQSLRYEWPLKAYSQMMVQFLKKWRGKRKHLLEISANKDFPTTLESLFDMDSYDIIPIANLDQLLLDKSSSDKFDNCKDIICANHVMHYATDKTKILKYVYRLLKKEGILLLAEANLNSLKYGSTWPLNMIYSIYDGMWSHSQLLNRADWLNLFKKVGFQQYGYAVMRAKYYDLGGILWAIK